MKKVKGVLSVTGAQNRQKSERAVPEALRSIGRANNGIVRIKEVKPALIEAGVIKRHKHAWGAIFTTLTRSPEFEKVPNQAGTFRLIENPAQSKLSVAS